MKNLRVYGNYKFIKKREVGILVNDLSTILEFTVNSLEINFVSADKIKEINSEHLNHHYSTDIITFNYSDEQKKIDGEIFISIDDATENARKYKVAIMEEISRLVIHGILHLLGYDDQHKRDKIIMKRLENKLLNTLKFILL